MLKKTNRLTSKFQFSVVKKYGIRYNTDFFTATVLKPKDFVGPTKIGFIVSNVIHKKAAKRNRIKRLLRESVRNILNKLPEDTWIVISVNHKILDKTYDEINDQVNRFIQKISISN